MMVNLKVAFRNLFKHRYTTAVSIFGLSVGLACFVIVLLFVNRETGYDRWSSSLKQVYRLSIAEERSDGVSNFVGTPYPLGNQAREQFPEVANVTRVITSQATIKVGDNSYLEKKAIMADSTFFSVFPYPFAYGHAATALASPGKVVLSPELAEKYFGKGDPVGKKLELVDYNGRQTYEVSGVFKRPGLSHLSFDCCFSYINNSPGYWGRRFYITYLQLRPGADVAALQKKTGKLFEEGFAGYLSSVADRQSSGSAVTLTSQQLLQKQGINRVTPVFERISNIHLDPQSLQWRGNKGDMPVNDYAQGNKQPVILFSLLGVLVLVMASINYINLAIARGAKRAKEVGVRKVVGAARRQLVMQFLTESLLQCIAALALAVLIMYAVLGYINTHFGLDLSLWDRESQGRNIVFALQVAAVVALTSLLSGIYPALFYSSYAPSRVFRGQFFKQAKGKPVRNMLITFQFIIAVAFVSAIAVVYRQIRFMQNNDPGFNSSHVMVIKPYATEKITPGRDEYQYDYLRQRLLGIPGVEGVATADTYPGMPTRNEQEAVADGKTTHLSFAYIGFDYFRLLDMPLQSGRDFSTTFSMDSVSSAVLNESAVKHLGFDNPLGRTVEILERKYQVTGVIKDNYSDGYNAAIRPTIYAIGAEEGMLMRGYIIIRLAPGNAAKATEAISRFWKTVEPDHPFNFSWMDSDFEALMLRYLQLQKLLTLLTVVALLIAFIGVFALTAFRAEQKKKEIGIRKVFGARPAHIILLLSKEFTAFILLSFLIAMPVMWVLMDRWLQDFAYRVELRWWLFALAGAGILLLSLVVMAYHGIRAMLASPEKNLRTE